MTEKIKYSVILPVYNEEKSLNELSRRLIEVLNSLGKNWEIIFIDDGSTDSSFARIKKLTQKNSGIKAIRFRKNFGKSAAYWCGFHFSSGEIIFTFDADLQDQPEEIPKFISKLEEGYDFVSGWKVKRYDPASAVLASRVFNFATSLLTGMKIHDFNCGLRGFKREAVFGLALYGDLYRFLPALVFWQGFRVGEVRVRHAPRRHGQSKYGWSKLPRGFFDLLTTVFLLKFLKRPLHFFGALGGLIFSLGFFINLFLTIVWFSGESIGKRPLLILGILLMIVGFQFVSTGLLGEMMVYFQTKNDKSYSLAEKIGKFQKSDAG